jgi:uncharacterized membrane protein
MQQQHVWQPAMAWQLMWIIGKLLQAAEAKVQLDSSSRRQRL